MANFTNQLLFHINSQGNRSPHELMKSGDLIEIGRDTNPFFRFYDVHQRTYAVTEQNGVVNQVPAMRFLGRVKNGTVKPNNLPGDAYEIAQHFLMLSRELLWENVRLSEFPDHPSRQRCVFLIESLVDVKRWLVAVSARPMNVVEVRASGQAHIADQGQLAGDSELLSVWQEKARAYWRGDRTADPLLEVLFEGKVEVVRVLDPAEYS